MINKVNAIIELVNRIIEEGGYNTPKITIVDCVPKLKSGASFNDIIVEPYSQYYNRVLLLPLGDNHTTDISEAVMGNKFSVIILNDMLRTTKEKGIFIYVYDNTNPDTDYTTRILTSVTELSYMTPRPINREPFNITMFDISVGYQRATGFSNATLDEIKAGIRLP